MLVQDVVTLHIMTMQCNDTRLAMRVAVKGYSCTADAQLDLIITVGGSTTALA